jgi:integrase
MAGSYKVGKKWRADWFDRDGVRHRKRFSSKREAENYLDEVKRDLNEDVWVDPNRVPLFSQVMDDWFQDRVAQGTKPGTGYRPASLSHWQGHIQHINALIGHLKANEIDVSAVRQMIVKLQLPKAQGGRGLSPRTTAYVKATTSRIFRFGMANQKKTGIRFDPLKLLETTKENSGEQTEEGERLHVDLHEVTEAEVLTPAEAKAVIFAAESGLYRTIITTLIYSGLRISEALALRWSDVDLEQSVIHVVRTLSTARVVPEKKAPEESEKKRANEVRWFDPKSKRGKRDIPIGETLVNILKSWREKCPESRLGLVFPNEFGEPANRTAVLKYGLKPALTKVGVTKYITLHRLRHTYASMLIHLRRTLPQVSLYLGHRDVMVTMTVYAHFLREKKRDEMDDLETLIANG